MARGRPKKPGGRSLWIPPELIRLVEALKDGDEAIALTEFAGWMKNLKEEVDNSNKPDVN